MHVAERQVGGTQAKKFLRLAQATLLLALGLDGCELHLLSGHGNRRPI